jgi:hypothetical protein
VERGLLNGVFSDCSSLRYSPFQKESETLAYKPKFPNLCYKILNAKKLDVKVGNIFSSSNLNHLQNL